MTKVKCVLGYFDTKLNRHVDIDEEFNVADDRAIQLVKAKVAVAIAEKVTEPAKATKTRKKKEA